MAVNALTYVKNVGKSFGYSTIDALKSYNPQITALAEGAKELSESLYETIDSFKAKMNDTDDEKGLIGIGRDGIAEMRNNLFEDLKTGNWYNKQRAEKIQDDAAMKMFGFDEEEFNLDDLDFNFDDDELDLNMDDDFDSTEAIVNAQKSSTESIVNAMDSVAAKASGAIAEANVRSADYIVASNRQSSKALYSLNNRGFQQVSAGISALNANIQQLVTLGEPLTSHMQNSATFYTESSEFHKNVMTKLDKIIELNSIKEESYRSSRKNLNYLLNDGVLDLSAYFDFISENVKEVTDDIKGMLDMVGGAEGIIKMATGSPLKMAVDGMTKILFPKLIKNTMINFNKHLEGFFAGAIDKLQYGEHKGVAAEIMDLLGDKIFPSDKYKEKADPSNYNKGKVNWDGRSKKALEEVIPTYLSIIASSLTGAPETRFNYSNGKFETVAGIKRAHDESKARYAKNAGGDFRTDALKLAENLGLTKEAQDKMKEEIESYFLRSFELGKSKMTNITKDNFDYQNFGLSKDSLAVLREILGSYARIGKTDKAMRAASENRLQRDRYGDYIRSIETSEGDPTLTLFNQSSIISSGSKKDKVKGGGLLGLDKYNHDIFFYLQGIYQYTGHVSDNIGFIGTGNLSTQRSRGKIQNGGSIVPVREISISTEAQESQDQASTNNTNSFIPTNPRDIINTHSGVDDLLIRNHAYEEGSTGERKTKEIEKRKERREARERELAAGSLTQEEFDALEAEDKEGTSSSTSNKILDKLKQYSEAAGDKDAGKGIKSVYQKIQGIVNKPAEIISEILGAGEVSLYHLIYGKDADDEKGLFAYFYSKADTLFTKFQDFMQSKWWDNLKKWTKDNFGKEDGEEGFWDATKRELKAAWRSESEKAGRFLGLTSERAPIEKPKTDNGEGETEPIVNNGNAAFGKKVTKTGIAAVSKGELIIPSKYNPFYHGDNDQEKQLRKENRAIGKFFGNYAEGGTIRDKINSITGRSTEEGALSQEFDPETNEWVYRDNKGNEVNRRKATKKEIRKQNRKNIAGTNSGRTKRNYRVKAGKDPHNVKEFLSGSVSQLVNSVQDGLRHILPEKPDEEKNIIDKILSEENSKRLKEANIPKEMKNNKGAIGTGAIIGAGASILTGCLVGPFAGAAIGAGIGLITRSEKVQKALFGPIGEDGERQGGILNKKVSEFITKKVPSIAKAGGIGSVAGLFFGSPVLGTIMGSAIGFAANSDKFKNWLFGDVGEDGTRQGGVISNKVQKAIKERLPKIGAGAIAGLVLGPFGSIPANIIFGSALGFVSSTDKFKEFLLGDGKENKGLAGDLRNFFFGKVDDKNKKQGLLVSINGIFEKLANDLRIGARNVFKSLKKRTRHIVAKAAHSTFGQWLGRSKLVKAAKGAVGAGIGAVIAPWKVARWGAQKIDEGLGRDSLNKGHGLYNNEEHRMMTAEERLKERERLGVDKRYMDRRAQSSRNFDQLLANGIQNEEQLGDLRKALEYYNDPTKSIDEEKIKVKKEFARQLEGMNVDPKTAWKLEKAMAGKGFHEFGETLDRMNLSDEDKATLRSQYDRINQLNNDRTNIKKDKNKARAELLAKGGIFDQIKGLDIKDDNDIDNMLELIKAEEKGRFNKTAEEKKAEEAEDRDKQNADNIKDIHDIINEIRDIMLGKTPKSEEENTDEENKTPAEEAAEAINEAADAINNAAERMSEQSNETTDANIEDHDDEQPRRKKKGIIRGGLNLLANIGPFRKLGALVGGFNSILDNLSSNGGIINKIFFGIKHAPANVKRIAKGLPGLVKDKLSDKYNGIKDKIKGLQRNSRGNIEGAGETQDLAFGGTAANGRKVTKTGVVAVSEGELIIPSDFNPFYHGTNDKEVQLSRENKAVDKFFGNYALGGIVGGLAKAGRVVSKVGKAVKSTASTVYNKTAGAREAIGKVANKVKEGGSKLYDAWKNRKSDDDSSGSSNEAADVVRNGGRNNSNGGNQQLAFNASGGANTSGGVLDGGLADGRSDVVTQTDAFGNIYQLRRNKQGELEMDRRDSETQNAMRSQNAIKDSLSGIPAIGEKIDSLKEAIVGDSSSSVKEEGTSLMDRLKNLGSTLFGEKSFLGGIFSFLTGTPLGGGGIQAALNAIKGGLPSIVKTGGLVTTVAMAANGAFNEPASKLVQLLTDGEEDQFGDSTRRTVNGKTLAEDEEGNVIKNEQGQYKTEDGEWVEGDINVVGENNNLDLNLKKNAVRGLASGNSSIIAGTAAKGINTVKHLVTGEKGNLTGKDLSGKGLATTITNVTDSILTSIRKNLDSLAAKLPDILRKVPFLGKYFSDPEKTSKMCSKLFDMIFDKVQKAGNLVKKFAAGFAKCLAVLNIIQVVTAATNAWGDAEAILGISNPTIGERGIAVLIATINTMIPFVGDLIPNDVLVDIFVKVVPIVGLDISGFNQKRSEAEKELAEWNEANGTDLDWDEYLMEQGRRGWWSKTKHNLNNIKENVKAKLAKPKGAKDVKATNGTLGSTASGKTQSIIEKQLDKVRDKTTNNVSSNSSNSSTNNLGYYDDGYYRGSSIGNDGSNISYENTGKSINISVNYGGSSGIKKKADSKKNKAIQKVNSAIGGASAIRTKTLRKAVGGSSGISPNRARRLVGGAVSGREDQDKNILNDISDLLGQISKVIKTLLDKLPTILNKIPYFGSKYFADTDKITKGCKELYDKIYHKIKEERKLLDGWAEKLAKFAPLLDIIEMVAEATNAWGDAESILGISDPTNVQRLIAVLVKVLGDMIPIISDIFDADELVDIATSAAKAMGLDLGNFMIQREEAERELAEYNKANGTDLDWDEYLTKMGKKGWLSKAEDFIDDNLDYNVKDTKGLSIVSDKVGSTASNATRSVAKKSGGGSNILRRRKKFRNVVGGSSNIFVSQRDDKYKDIPFGGSNIGDVGCAPATATMLMNYERPGSMTMDKAIRAAKNYQQDEGTSADYFDSILRQNGLESNYIDSTTKSGKQSIIDDLASGRPAVLLGQDATNESKEKSPFGPSKHFVMATGFDDYGNVIINDPESNRPDKVYNPSILNKVDMAVTTNQTDIDENTDEIIANTKPIGGASAPPAVPDNEITKKVYGFLTKNGYSPAAASGVLANAASESHVDPTAIQNNGKGPAAGMFQWENWRDKSARWLALNNYAASKGKDWTDLDSQLEFFNQEMHGVDIGKNRLNTERVPKNEPQYVAKPLPNGIEDFKKLDDPLEAALQFETAFERGGKPRMEKRFENARQYYNLYSGSEYNGQYTPGGVGSVEGGKEIDTSKENIVEDSSKPLDGNTSADASSGVGDILGTISSAFSNIFDNIFSMGGNNSDSSSSSNIFAPNSSSDSQYGNCSDGSCGTLASGEGQGTAQSFIDIARSQVGEAEQYDNITKYGEFMGANGQPWCASFVSWVMDQTFNGNKDIRDKALRGKPSASVAGLWDNFKRSNAMTQDPQPGDIVIYKNNASHTGLVESVEDGVVHTIEGNTSGGDNNYNRNGGMVARKTFKVGGNKRVTGYGRPDWKTAEDMFSKIEANNKAAVTGSKLTSKDKVNAAQTLTGQGSGITDGKPVVQVQKPKKKETINPTMLKNKIGAGTKTNNVKNSAPPVQSTDSQSITLLKAMVRLLESIVNNTNSIDNIGDTLSDYCEGKSTDSTEFNKAKNSFSSPNNNNGGTSPSEDPALKDLMNTLGTIAMG